jgi:hypothetical protein
MARPEAMRAMMETILRNLETHEREAGQEDEGEKDVRGKASGAHAIQR